MQHMGPSVPHPPIYPECHAGNHRRQKNDTNSLQTNGLATHASAVEHQLSVQPEGDRGAWVEGFSKFIHCAKQLFLLAYYNLVALLRFVGRGKEVIEFGPLT